MSPMTLASMRGQTEAPPTTESASATLTTAPALRRVGWVGLGKLGLTCASVIADRGFRVTGYDVVPAPELQHPAERGLREVLDRVRVAGSMTIAGSIEAVVKDADLVFVSVQTPHAPAYGGEIEATQREPRDFEYGYLISAVAEICASAARLRTPVTVVVVSTVLPGTCARVLEPLMNEWTALVYNPFFIAMGTTIDDFLGPEFVLLGARDDHALWPVEQFYRDLLPKPTPTARMSIVDAEMVKVSYNTFISLKIVWANTLMELCHKTGADCDVVVDALELATDRIISPRYMRGGMGDGGHCHPRDLIAMSWLADRVELSYDLLGGLARAREDQSRWLAGLAERWHEVTGHRIAILGKSYKPESPLTGGSPALLLASQLKRYSPVEHSDPYTDGEMGLLNEPRVFVIATKHQLYADLQYPAGSVVLDPWGYVPDQPGVTVVRIGRKSPL
jgi:UDPglucose 6-dehydrogenase